MVTSTETEVQKPLPPPWDRIFGLSSRIFVWLLLFSLIYILRPFFLLLFLTFVFAYILQHGVQGLEHRIRNRPIRVVLVAGVFLSTLITIGIFLAPRFEAQASNLTGRYQAYLLTIDKELEKLRGSSDFFKHRLEGVEADDLMGSLLGFIDDSGQGAGGAQPPETPGGQGPAPTTEPTAGPGTTINPTAQRERLERALDQLRKIAEPILSIGSAFLLSLLFSFLIVLDLPKLSRAVAGLKHTKVGFIYDEVAENIRDFGRMLGRALEAQLFIAICNTLLTAIGLFCLGLTNNLVFLSTIVFFCSFIPVAGVFLSSTPICLEALSQSGVQLMLFAIVLILIIHFVEAYFLNPKIFGHHLHMNAVLVLIVLTIGGKLFGVWGLVLGLPVVNYFFGHAIRYKDQRLKSETAAAA